MTKRNIKKPEPVNINNLHRRSLSEDIQSVILKRDKFIQQFNGACRFGKIESLKELTQSPSWKTMSDLNFSKGFEYVVEKNQVEVLKYFIKEPLWKKILNENFDSMYRQATDDNKKDILDLFHKTKHFIPHILPYLLTYGETEAIVSIIDNKEFKIVEQLNTPKTRYNKMLKEALVSTTSFNNETLATYFLNLDKTFTYPYFYQQIPEALLSSYALGNKDIFQLLCQRALELNPQIQTEEFISPLRSRAPAQIFDTVYERFNRVVIEAERDKLNKTVGVASNTALPGSRDLTVSLKPQYKI